MIRYGYVDLRMHLMIFNIMRYARANKFPLQYP